MKDSTCQGSSLMLSKNFFAFEESDDGDNTHVSVQSIDIDKNNPYEMSAKEIKELLLEK